MDDALDEEIAKARKALAYSREQWAMWQRKIDVDAASLAALEKAAELRPVAIAPPGAREHRVEGSRRGGRQTGAISQTWRNILLYMAFRHPNGASDAEIVEIAREAGLANIREKGV